MVRCIEALKFLEERVPSPKRSLGHFDGAPALPSIDRHCMHCDNVCVRVHCMYFRLSSHSSCICTSVHAAEAYIYDTPTVALHDQVRHSGKDRSCVCSLHKTCESVTNRCICSDGNNSSIYICIYVYIYIVTYIQKGE